MAIKYEWAEGAPYRGFDPQAFGKVYHKLSKTQTVVASQDIVDKARPEDSPIHRNFEWDDSVAGEKFRLQQAGGYCRHIRIVIKTANAPSRRERIAVHIRTKNENGYVRPEHAFKDAEWREHVLRTAFLALRGLQTRYKNLVEFSQVWAAIDAIEADLVAMQK